MNIKKTLLSFCLCAGMLLSPLAMSGCTKQNTPVKSKPTNVYRVETLYEKVNRYDSQNFEGREEINDLQGAGNAIFLTGYSYDKDWNSKEFIRRLDTETGDFTDITLPAQENDGNSYRMCTRIAEDNTIWYVNSSGSVDEETGNYREDLFLCHVSADGTVLASAELYELLGVKREDNYLYVNYLNIIDGSPILTADSNGVYILSPDLTSVRKVDIKDCSNVFQAIPGEHTMLLCYYTEPDYKQKMVSLDVAAGTVGESLPLSDEITNYLYTASASKDYDFVYQTNLGIYGYDIATETTTELLNWINSDINASYIRNTYITEDGVVYAFMQNWKSNSNTISVYKMTRIPDEEVKEKYILTLGTVGAYGDFIDAIVAFNRQSEEYRITIRDYSIYNNEDNEWRGAITRFDSDITSGNIPDIIKLSSDLPFQKYAVKGLFADLNPFLESDPAIDRADLYDNILEALSVDGKLYQIIPAFYLRTLAAKSSLVGDEDGITMDTLLSAVEKLNDGADPFGGEVTREQFLREVCSVARDQFIDKSRGTCSFDTPEFIKILEFAATLPEKTIWETVNWDEVGEDFYLKRDYMYRENNALFCQRSLCNYRDFWELQEGLFGERISLVGYPNANKMGNSIEPTESFAISSQSPCKEGAWAFISSYIAKGKTVDTDSMLYSFSIFRSVNKKLEEDALAYTRQSDYDGVIVPKEAIVEEVVVDEEIAVDDDMIAPGYGGDTQNYIWPYWIANEQIELGRMQQEAADHLTAVLESVSQLYQYDEAVMNIILEEASAFFSGQKTAETVASLIQNRVFIVVNESR